MKSIRYYQFATWYLLLLGSLSFSCGSPAGSDDLDDLPDASALSSLNGHKIDFYYNYNNKLYRAISINMSSSGDFDALSYAAKEMLGGYTCSYNKTGDYAAYLEMLINFWPASGNEYNPQHIYKLNMTFTSANQGLAEGKVYYTILYNGSSIKVFDKLRWYFIVDSSELPDQAAIDREIDNIDQGNNSDQGNIPTSLKAGDAILFSSSTPMGFGYFKITGENSGQWNDVEIPNISLAFSNATYSYTVTGKNTATLTSVNNQSKTGRAWSIVVQLEFEDHDSGKCTVQEQLIGVTGSSTYSKTFIIK